jgi:chromosome segregation ATPase
MIDFTEKEFLFSKKMSEEVNLNQMNAFLKGLKEIPEVKNAGAERENGISSQNIPIRQIVEVLEKAIKDTSTALAEKTRDSERLSAELSSKSAEAGRLNQEVESLKSQIKSLEAAHSAKLQEATATTESARQEATQELNRRLKELSNTKNKALSNQTASHQAAKAAWISEKETLERQLQELNDDLQAKTEAQSRLEVEIADLKEANRKLENEISKYKKILFQSKQTIETLTNRVNSYKRAYNTLQTEVTSIYKRYSNNGKLLTSNAVVKKLTEPVAASPTGEVAEPPTEPEQNGGSKKRITRKPKSKSTKSTKPKSKSTKPKRKSTKSKSKSTKPKRKSVKN